MNKNYEIYDEFELGDIVFSEVVIIYVMHVIHMHLVAVYGIAFVFLYSSITIWL